LRSVSALEAPLTVCEDFATLATVLYFIAARKGHARRQMAIFLVWAFCLAAVATMGWAVSGMEYRQTTLNRPFFFSAAPLVVVTFGWHILVLTTYLLGSVCKLVVKRQDQSIPAVELQSLGVKQQSSGSESTPATTTTVTTNGDSECSVLADLCDYDRYGSGMDQIFVGSCMAHPVRPLISLCSQE